MTSQLDFFAAPVPVATERFVRPQVIVKDVANTDDETMARHLETIGNYRILRKLQLRPIVEHPRPEFPRRGIILDTETTGLNHRTDEIIEIGVIAFTSMMRESSATSSVSMADCGSRQSRSRPTSPA